MYRTLFKCNEKNEQKFCEFKQLTPVEKRIVYIVLNLSLQWLRKKNIISDSISEERTVQNILLLENHTYHQSMKEKKNHTLVKIAMLVSIKKLT